VKVAGVSRGQAESRRRGAREKISAARHSRESESVTRADLVAIHGRTRAA
jgi:hypothetical protein